MDFENSLKEFGIELNQIQKDRFEEYFRLLVEWNEKMNLTAITDRDEVYVKHFLDSLSFIKVNPASEDFSLLDVGTGAGFPGIPIKILYPNAKITLMDSLQKRITFLNEVVNALHLNDEGSITAVHARAEDLAKEKEHREQYDYVVSRAVANLSTLSEYCLPFVKVGGAFVSFKSEKATEELKDAKKAIYLLGGEFKEEIAFTLPDSDFKRILLVIEKKTPTSVKYPRKAGMPAKNPLGQ